MNKDILRQWTVIITTAFALVVNGLANALPLNGRQTGEISDSFNVIFVPAGYVFSIWGLIYIALAAYTFYQALPAQRANPRLRSTGWWVAASNIFNSAWIFFWHYGLFAATLIAMLGILTSLIIVYLRLDIGRAHFTNIERLAVAMPFSIYLGWITVATIANVTAVLADLGWRGGGISEATWAVILLAAGVIIAALMAFTRSDSAYLLVLVWAFTGIAVRWPDLPAVNTAGFTAAALVLVLLAVSRVIPYRLGTIRQSAR